MAKPSCEIKREGGTWSRICLTSLPLNERQRNVLNRGGTVTLNGNKVRRVNYKDRKETRKPR